MWAILIAFLILLGPVGAALLIGVLIGSFLATLYYRGLGNTVDDGFCEQTDMGVETWILGRPELVQSKPKLIKNSVIHLKSNC